MEDTGLNTQETLSLIESKEFKEILTGTIRVLINNRSFSSLSEGCRWKRSPQERLLEKGILNTEDIIEEFQKISRRSSNLSSGEREFIKMLIYKSMIIYKSMNQTLISYRRQGKNLKRESDGKES